jgi:HAE1 family hydrophobic/amphiphilic exporter-1
MLSKFFLDRPVFAWVIAIVIMLVGALAIYSLPISQYPPIAPPSIYIASSYPGASAGHREQRHPDHRTKDEGP